MDDLNPVLYLQSIQNSQGVRFPPAALNESGIRYRKGPNNSYFLEFADPQHAKAIMAVKAHVLSGLSYHIDYAHVRNTSEAKSHRMAILEASIRQAYEDRRRSPSSTTSKRSLSPTHHVTPSPHPMAVDPVVAGDTTVQEACRFDDATGPRDESDEEAMPVSPSHRTDGSTRTTSPPSDTHPDSGEPKNSGSPSSLPPSDDYSSSNDTSSGGSEEAKGQGRRD